MYVPPHATPTEQEIEDLILQLPIPFIFMGDFNARYSLWGSQKQNQKGKLIENIILNNDITLLNTKQSTYIHPATGCLSSIDLTLCSASIALDYSWICQNDTHGSDHFPIIIYSNKSYSSSSQLPQFWKINKVDGSKFTVLCENTLNSTTNNNTTTIHQFVDILISVANDTIPKTHSKMKIVLKLTAPAHSDKSNWKLSTAVAERENAM